MTVSESSTYIVLTNNPIGFTTILVLTLRPVVRDERLESGGG